MPEPTYNDPGPIVEGFPACSGSHSSWHPAVNMVCYELRRADDGTSQSERWRCPTCGALFSCDLDKVRAIPVGLHG